ncbi:MAG: hypothetical protein GXO91_04835 [FCB group bacterium]|nr:hypothetical protein [FCB group bacterium]
MSFAPEELSRRSRLYSLFNKIKSAGGTLIIGGDFFDFWFDFRTVIPSYYSDVIGELRELQKAGIDIHYVVGNHDYWDFGAFTRLFGAKVYKEDLRFTVGKETVLLTHGDGILSRDTRYRVMKKIIRSPVSIFCFRLLHPAVGCWVARRVSKSSSNHNHHSPREKDLLELSAYAEKHWNTGTKTVLMGHYHQTGISSAGEYKFIHLGDWLTHFTVTVRDHLGWRQESA